MVTLGGIGSNHARATAMAARQLGLPSHLFLITKEETIEVNTLSFEAPDIECSSPTPAFKVLL